MSVWSRLWFFQWSCMDVRVGLWRKLSTKKFMLLNCGVGEDFWEFLGLQGDPTSPSWRRSVLGVHWKDWCWSWNSTKIPLWPPHAKSWLIGKATDAGRDWGQEEKGKTEDEMAGWHQRLDGYEFVWTLGGGDGQGGLVCWDSWGHRESDMTEWLNWTELNCGGQRRQWHPLQCSCLENPREWGAWWAAVYGVAQSQTRLKQPSSSSSNYGAGEDSWARWSNQSILKEINPEYS